jgi:hypothetical protein
MAKNYDDTIEEIKQEYFHHKKEADRFKTLLIAAGIELGPTNGQNVKTGNGVSQHHVETATRATFENNIISILKEHNTPVDTKTLHEEYEKQSGKEVIAKNFSSKLSIVSKGKGTIKNQNFKKIKNGPKYWWGLSGWFDDKKFNETYKQKISEKVGQRL